MKPLDGLLDTSFLVRYLIGEPPDQARRARAVIESRSRLGVTDVGIVETAYVLSAVYRVPREQVVDALIGFVQRRNIVPVGMKKEHVVAGLLMCRPSGRVSFGDAMIWAMAKAHGIAAVYTFDERFPSNGVRLLSHSPGG